MEGEAGGGVATASVVLAAAVVDGAASGVGDCAIIAVATNGRAGSRSMVEREIVR